MLAILTLFFILSGAAGLFYESVWSRYLGLFVGHNAYAQVIVLVIFLGGMAIGAMVVGTLTDRIREPLFGYALVEAAVGLVGLFFQDIYVGRHRLGLRLGLSRNGRLGDRSPSPSGASRRC